MSHCISIAVACGFAILWTLVSPGAAHADLVLGPEVFVIPSVMVFFVILVVAILARLLLLALRGKRKEERRRGSAVEVVAAAVLSVLFFIVTYGGYEQSRKNRYREHPRSMLGAIRSTQVAYFAEWSYWVGNQSFTPVLDRAGSKERVDWVTTTRFSVLGFAPEGKVQCSYSLEGTNWPSAEAGFIARMACDLDEDGAVAIWTITDKDTEVTKSGAPF
jgi:hypothetical protein